jgi:hypothetical protein
MFKSYDMYDFSKEEIAQINTVKSLNEMWMNMEKFIFYDYEKNNW